MKNKSFKYNSGIKAHGDIRNIILDDDGYIKFGATFGEEEYPVIFSNKKYCEIGKMVKRSI